MLSAGIVRSDNALVVSFVKLFLFPNLLSCILFAWTCFFIATISTGPSSWGDPLPMLLTALHAPLRPRARVAELEALALKILRVTAVRMLVIDELHNMLA